MVDSDCAEIACELFSVSSGKGKIITIESPLGRHNEINIAELDPVTHTVKMERYEYHTVFRDDKYVYDPRLSNNPIPRGDYQSMVKKLNPEGVRVYEGDPWSPVEVERRGKLTIKAGRL